MNLFNAMTSTSTRWLRRWLCASLLLLPAFAFGQVSCSTYGGSQQLALPATVTVARDLPNGSLLTNWTTTPQSTNWWTCSVQGVGNLAGLVVGTGSTTSSPQTAYTVTYNGNQVGVYPTNVPGIGIALAGWLYASGFASQCGWYAGGFQGFTPSTNRTGLECQYTTGSGTMTVNTGAQVAVALVKIGDITPGTVSGTVMQAYAEANQVPAPQYGTVTFTITPVTVTVLTCMTPDITVPMGTHIASEIPTVGSLSANPASFALQFNNCPGGTAVSGTSSGQVHSVQYRIDPTSGLVPGVSNVAALSGSPAATGVGIQLFTSTGAVFPLGTWQTLAGYNSGVQASYSVPMSARYYRTATITAGPANSSMVMTVQYQ